MSGFSFPGRPGDEPLLDMVFDRCPLPPEAPPEMHDLAQLLVALAGPAEPGELAGEAAALGAFAQLVSPAGVSPPAPRALRRWSARTRLRVLRGRVRLALVLVLAVVALAGATAAYAGVLPGPVQEMAHAGFGAPAPAPATHHHHDKHRLIVSEPRPAVRPRPRPAARNSSPRPSLGPVGRSRPGGIDRYANNANIPNPIFDHGSPPPSYGSAARPCPTSGTAAQKPPAHGFGSGQPATGTTSCTVTPRPTPTTSPTR